jgi:hypothetical protein
LDPKFSHDKFKYDAKEDIFICPSGNKLTYRTKSVEKGKFVKIYKSIECINCEFKSICTKDKKGRRVGRWEHQSILDEMVKRMRSNPEKYKKRMMMAELLLGR